MALVAALPAVVQIVLLVRYLQPSSLDGKFQTYATVNMLAAGVPFRDFPVYLGLLVTRTVGALAGWTGHDIVGVQMAAILAVNAAFIVSTIVLLRLALVPARWQAALLAGIALGMLALPGDGSVALRVLVDPGLSLPGLRAFAVVAAALAAMAAERGLARGLARGRLPQALRPVLYGAAGGVLALWSNDFGLGSLAALLIMPVLLALHPFRPAVALWCLVAGPAAAFASFTAVLLLHGATPADWYVSNVSSIAATQFWLFTPWLEWAHAYTPVDLVAVAFGLKVATVSPAQGMALFALALVHVWLVVTTVARADRRDPLRVALTVLSLAAWAGAFAASVGGHFEPHYWAMFGYGGLFAALRLARERRGAGDRGASAATPLPAMSSPVMSLSVIPLVAIPLVVWAGTVALLREPAAAAALGRVLGGGAWTYEPALGAGLKEDEARAFRVLSSLAPVADRCGVPRDARAIEAYPSLVGVALKGRPPAAAQSLITVLGPAAEQRFARYVRARRPWLATTIAPEFSQWAGWTMRARWFWYRTLLENGYRPVGRTDQHVLWLRETDGPPPGTEGLCRVAPSRGGAAALVVAPAGGAAGPGRTAVVTLDYRTVPTGGGPNRPLRMLARVTETAGTAHAVPIWPERTWLRYGAPDRASGYETMFSPAGTGPATLTLAGQPERGTRVEIAACRARYLDFDAYAPVPMIDRDPAIVRRIARAACAARR